LNDLNSENVKPRPMLMSPILPLNQRSPRVQKRSFCLSLDGKAHRTKQRPSAPISCDTLMFVCGRWTRPNVTAPAAPGARARAIRRAPAVEGGHLRRRSRQCARAQSCGYYEVLSSSIMISGATILAWSDEGATVTSTIGKPGTCRRQQPEAACAKGRLRPVTFARAKSDEIPLRHSHQQAAHDAGRRAASTSTSATPPLHLSSACALRPAHKSITCAEPELPGDRPGLRVGLRVGAGAGGAGSRLD
jgi:hypothetical protein